MLVITFELKSVQEMLLTKRLRAKFMIFPVIHGPFGSTTLPIPSPFSISLGESKRYYLAGYGFRDYGLEATNITETACTMQPFSPSGIPGGLSFHQPINLNIKDSIQLRINDQPYLGRIIPKVLWRPHA